MGTIGGSPFVAEDAIALVDQSSKTAKIVLTSTPSACADVRDNILRQNARVVLMEVFDNAATDAKLIAGSYMTSSSGPAPARSSLFESNVTDGQCNVSYDPPPDGTGDGTVTVSSVNGTTVTGSFDVIMESGEHVTGTFEPTACPELASHSGTPTCAP